MGADCAQRSEGHLEGESAGEDVVDEHHWASLKPLVRLKVGPRSQGGRGVSAMLGEALGGLVLKKPQSIEGEATIPAEALSEQRRQVKTSTTESFGIRRDGHQGGMKGPDPAVVHPFHVASEGLHADPVLPVFGSANGLSEISRVGASCPDPGAFACGQGGRAPARLLSAGQMPGGDHRSDYTQPHVKEPTPYG